MSRLRMSVFLMLSNDQATHNLVFIMCSVIEWIDMFHGFHNFVMTLVMYTGRWFAGVILFYFKM